MSDVTLVLEAAERADPQAAQELLPLVYDELRRLAGARMASQPAGHTLQATALVHEAYLRLLGHGEHSWQNRWHFFAAAAEAMRHILVDRARRKATMRRGGGLHPVDLDNIKVASEAPDDALILVNDALEQLLAHDPQSAELVKLRFFGGFTFEQAAELLGVSERTAKRMWTYARAWLFKHIERGE